MTLILNNDEIDRILTMDLCLNILEDLYREYGNGRTVDIPRCDAVVPSKGPDHVYGLKTMSGCVPYFGKAAIRLNSDTIYHPTIDGIQRRVKSPCSIRAEMGGLVLLFDIANGEPVAIFPDGMIQRMRVGATNGLAAKYLARDDSKILALIGSGWQASGQIMAFCQVRKLEEVRVYSPNADRRQSFCKEMEPHVRVKMIPVGSADEAVRGADIIAAGTSSMVPVLKKEWLKPGIHVSSIKKQEISWEVITGCDLFFLHTNRIFTQTNYFMESDKEPNPEVKKGWWSGRQEEMLVRKVFPDMGDLLTGKVSRKNPSRSDHGFPEQCGIRDSICGSRCESL